MPVQDYDINAQIDKIANHVDIILNNAFIRKGLTKIVVPREYQLGMEIILSKSDNYKINGYLFDELYRGILGLAMWSYKARTEILPELKYYLADESMPETERIREQMALENLKSNLAILSDQINNLYIKTVAADKAAHNRKQPVYLRIKDLGNIGQLLTSDSRGFLN